MESGLVWIIQVSFFLLFITHVCSGCKCGSSWEWHAERVRCYRTLNRHRSLPICYYSFFCFSIYLWFFSHPSAVVSRLSLVIARETFIFCLKPRAYQFSCKLNQSFNRDEASFFFSLRDSSLHKNETLASPLPVNLSLGACDGRVIYSRSRSSWVITLRP